MYRAACDGYLREFCRRHDMDFANAYWVADKHGETAGINDYFVDMATIVTDVDGDVPDEYFFKWYDYYINMHEQGEEYVPNYENWLKMGCPCKSAEEMAKITKEKINNYEQQTINNGQWIMDNG
jgi:hypothetical protein